jgi:natural product biosynthesis luciferase-like monooxygenase protein
MPRSIDTVAVMMGILKAGAAYIPLDPEYPASRIRFIVADSGIRCAFATPETEQTFSDLPIELLKPQALSRHPAGPVTDKPGDVAYVIYTSGSTGNPKGVVVTHRNLSNFLLGIDEVLGEDRGAMLSVTSISFDISVLELWWSLCRGMKVVLYEDPFSNSVEPHLAPDRSIAFSLYYWNTETGDDRAAGIYDLLLEGARFADQHGFDAVWTPERHFGSFGGLYPNPSVTSAAIAAVTSKVAIRAGSCVLPLHHPVRVAEEWSVVDNLSKGRAGMSIASGWMPTDFVIQPENFATAKEVMFENAEIVQKLWRGEAVEFEGPNGTQSISTLPRPVQDSLPMWVTTAGSRDTFERAGKLGYNVLTHLLGQSKDDLEGNVKAYRDAWNEAGHEGRGCVTLMLHTLVAGDKDEARELAREPMKNFLKSSLSLVKDATWDFPTYQKFSDGSKESMDRYFEQLDEDDFDELLEHAFHRYFEQAGLFGSVADCVATVNDVIGIDVDEIGCLIDYGIEEKTVLKKLPNLNKLKNKFQDIHSESVNDLVARHGITHMQCTPSQANMFMIDPDAVDGMATLDYLLVGGEPINQQLADTLCSHVSGRVFNMYGPTETTVW